MESAKSVKPLKLWYSVLLFMIPALFGVGAHYVLAPYLVQTGVSQENAYNSALLLVFVGLLLAVLWALRREGWPLKWASMKERLRLEPMTGKAWRWTLLFLLLYLLLSYGLGNLAGMVYGYFQFWPPDADVPLTNIPFAVILLVLNVVSEELWWRGYILPRQELQHGEYAWVVNGILWPFFHLFKWWAIPFLLLKQWMIPFIAQRLKNTTPALIIHFVSNGMGILITLLPLLMK
jgi:membrane protease YdiL (CAAX protease family)